jgi:hypothetical protein
LRRPYDVALTREGNIAIADGGNLRILVWSLEGQFLMKIMTGIESPFRSYPSGVRIDRRTGNFVVMDGPLEVVNIYSPEGKMVKSFGKGTSKEQFSRNTYALELDQEGNIIIPDAGK